MSLKGIILVHHSHTDFGFTHEQPVMKRLYGRFLLEALDRIEADLHLPDGLGFTWTCETTLEPTMAGPEALDRIREACQRGRLEIMGAAGHLTPLADPGELADSLAPARRLQDLGIPVRHVMSCDVTGQNRTWVDAMLDAGFQGYSTAINTHFGRAPFRRPNCFRWQGPSGRSIPVLNGFHYGMGGLLGMEGRDISDFRDIHLPRLLHHLDEVGYDLPWLMVQGVHPFGDNGGPWPAMAEFARAWAESGESLEVRCGTPADFWRLMERHQDALPVHDGDWNDFWNFGCLSRAWELGVVRDARMRRRAALRLGVDSPQPVLEYLEHTWTADWASARPWDEDAWVQSLHKSHLAASARSESIWALREGLASLADQAAGPGSDHLLIVNPLPVEATIRGLIPAGSARPRGAAGIAALHYQDRNSQVDLIEQAEKPDDAWGQTPTSLIRPTRLPAESWTILTQAEAAFDPWADRRTHSKTEIRHRGHRLVFDTERGGLRTWETEDRSWLDPEAEPLGTMIRERVAREAPGRGETFDMEWNAPDIELPSGWKPDWRSEVERGGVCRSHQVVETEIGTWVRQEVECPGLESPMKLSFHLPADDDWIEVEAEWRMGIDPWPENRFLLFPFRIPGEPSHDIGGASCSPRTGLLPGSCCDWFTAQNWAAWGDDSARILIGLSRNPMFMWGGLRFGRIHETFADGPAHLYAWVTGNMWQCNFPTIQPGPIRARWRLLAEAHPAADPHAFGLEAAAHGPCLQYCGRPKGPASGILPGERVSRQANS
ncbi:MAG: hypothetical protein MH204_10390 [Fimbriimonadaceae bacterium]|nr:hypothetical protein [Fimbriimonadaceae bacterium]